MTTIDNGGTRAPIRVGIIGFGNAGRLIHAPLIRATSGFALAAISSSRVESVRETAPDVTAYANAHAMLAAPDIDLIVVATPPESHATWASASLRAGKHVLVEKPFAVHASEAAGILALAQSVDRMVTVFHNRRFDSCFQSVRTVIESGALGRINHYESQYNRFNQTVNDDWKAPAQPGSGLWFDTGVHIVDQTIQLFGLPEAIGMATAHNRSGSAADDWCHAVLHFSDKRAVLHCSMLVAGGVPRFAVHGDTASVLKHVADIQGRQLWSGMAPDAPGYGRDDDPPVLIGADGSRTPQPVAAGDYRGFFRALGQAIRGEGPNPTTPRDMLGVMAVLEAGVASAREGRVMPVVLPEIAA